MNDRQLKLRLLNASLLGILAYILLLVITPRTPKFETMLGSSTLSIVTGKVFHLFSSIPFSLIAFASLVLFVRLRPLKKGRLSRGLHGGMVLVYMVVHLLSPGWF
jgi:hypothetical protein